MSELTVIIFGLLDFNVNLEQPIPLWTLIVIMAILVVLGILYLLLRFSGNAIILKSRIDDWRSSRAERTEQKVIAENLESKFYASQEEINKNAGFNVLPYHMKIKWQNRDDVRSIVSTKKDQFWIVMKKREDQSENFVRYVGASIETNIVYRTKRYLSEPIKRAIELTMIKKIITVELEDALEYFDENIYKHDVEKYQFLNDYVEGLTDLDSKGLFIRAYLREIHDFGNRTFPKTATKEIKDEMNELTTFFSAIGRRRDGEQVRRTCEGKSLRVGVLFIAGKHSSTEIKQFIEKPESSPYANDIRDYINHNIQSIYLFARGSFIELATSLSKHFENDVSVQNSYRIPFTDREKKKNAIVCIIRLRLPHS